MFDFSVLLPMVVGNRQKQVGGRLVTEAGTKLQGIQGFARRHRSLLASSGEGAYTVPKGP